MPASTRVLALLVLLPAVAAAQQPLFFPADPEAPAEMTPREAELLDHHLSSPRTHQVMVGTVGPAAFELPELSVSVMPGHAVTFQRELVEHRAPGDYSWRGHSDDAATFALFVVRDGLVTGSIRVDGELFLLQPLSGDLHVLARSAEAGPAHPPGWDAFQETASRKHGERVSPAAPSDWPGYTYRQRHRSATATPVVTLIAAYTATAAAQSADIVGLIQLSIDEANYTLDRSSVDHRFTLVHTYQTGTSELGETMLTNIIRFSESDNGYYDEVHDLRSQYEADLAMLIGNFSNKCGIAWHWASNPGSGFSATHTECVVGSFVVAHELGHNMGAQHNPEQDANGHFSFAHGTTNVTEGWRTVMAYDRAACPAGGCARIPFWSSPNVFYHGSVTGDADVRDNVRVLNLTAGQIAGYFGTAGGPAATVSVPDIQVTLAEGEATTVEVDINSVGEALLLWQASMATGAGGAGARAAAAGGGPSATTVAGHRTLPDAFGYTWRDSRSPDGPEFSWSDLAVEGTPIPLASFSTSCGWGPADEGYASVSLPFDFPFYGGQHASVRVAVNGFLTFGAYDDCSFNAEPIGTAAEPNALIAPLWIDLDLDSGGGGAIYTHDPGDGRFIVQWNATRFGGTIPRIFQAILYESGDIRFQYDSPERITMEGGFVHRHTVGIESPDGTDGLQMSHVSGGDFSQFGYIRGGLAIHITPPVQWATLSPGAGATAVGSSSTVTLSLDASAVEPGIHTGEVRIRTNDPFDPLISIPVTFDVRPLAATVSGGPGWRMMAPAATDLSVSDLAALNLVQGVPGFYGDAAPNLYAGYDGSAWTTFSGGGDMLPSGRGFLWYLYDADFDPGGPSQSYALPMTLLGGGAVPATDVVVPLHTSGNHWNLVGNPADGSLDVSDLGNWPGGAGLASAVPQIWDPNLGSGSYRLATDIGNLVSAWQGFFLESSTATELTIPLSAQTTGGDFYRPADAGGQRMIGFELTAAADGTMLVDRAALLLFAEEASDEWDLLDAQKLRPLAHPHVALAFAGERFADGAPETVLKAQESRPLDPDDFEVKLHLQSAGFSGELTLAWPTFENVPEDWELTLTDLSSGATVDLWEDTSYHFSVTDQGGRVDAAVLDLAAPAISVREAGPARFRLDLRAGNPVTADDQPHAAELAFDGVYPHPFTERANVVYRLPVSADVRISLYDILGRQLTTVELPAQTPGTHTYVLEAPGLASGVYLLRLEAADQSIVTRLVVAR